MAWLLAEIAQLLWSLLLWNQRLCCSRPSCLHPAHSWYVGVVFQALCQEHLLPVGECLCTFVRVCLSVCVHIYICTYASKIAAIRLERGCAWLQFVCVYRENMDLASCLALTALTLPPGEIRLRERTGCRLKKSSDLYAYNSKYTL